MDQGQYNNTTFARFHLRASYPYQTDLQTIQVTAFPTAGPNSGIVPWYKKPNSSQGLSMVRVDGNQISGINSPVEVGWFYLIPIIFKGF